MWVSVCLPVYPAQRESQRSKEEVDSEEGSKLDLSFRLRYHPIQQNMVFRDSVEKSKEGENDTKNTKPD